MAELILPVVVSLAGNLLLGLLTSQPSKQPLDPAKMPTAELGKPLPIIYQSAKVAGNLFWANEPIEVEVESDNQGGKGMGRRQKEKTWFQSGAWAATWRNPVELRAVYLNGDPIYDLDSQDADLIERTQEFAEKIEWYTGTFGQDYSPTLVAAEGQVPRFNYMSYLVIKDLDLKKYGNALPSVMMRVKTVQEFTLGSMIRDLITLSKINNPVFGFDILTVDPSVDEIPLKGSYLTSDGQSYKDLLEPILSFHNLVVEETTPGQYKITKASEDIANQFPLRSLPFWEVVGAGQSGYQIETFGQEKVSTEAVIQFKDIDKDYDNNSVQKVKYDSNLVNSTNLTVQLLLDRSEASEGCERILRAGHAKKSKLTIQLPITLFVGSNPLILGSIFTLTGVDELEGINWKISELTFGKDCVVEVLAEQFQPFLGQYRSLTSRSGKRIIAGGNTATAEASLIFAIFDTNLINLEDDPRDGYYFAYSSQSNSPAYVYTSSDGVTYSFLEAITSPTVTGKTLSALPVSSSTVPDFTTELIVQIQPTDSLENFNETSWLREDRIAVVGQELVNFRFAEPLGGGIWKLTHLIRGVHGTESLTGNHSVDESFAILKLRDFTCPRLLADSSPLKYFKATTKPNSDISTLSPFVFSNTRASAKPLAPVEKPILKLPNGDILISWYDRAVGDWLAQDDLISASNPDGDTFRLVILDGINSVRTPLITGLEYLYTLTQQIADFGTEQFSVDFEVFQTNTLINKGYKSVNYGDF